MPNPRTRSSDITHCAAVKALQNREILSSSNSIHTTWEPVAHGHPPTFYRSHLQRLH